MRHADAGYDIAKTCAREQQLDLPMLTVNKEQYQMTTLLIQPGTLSLAQLRQVHNAPYQLSLCPAALPAITASNNAVESVLAAGNVVYGINTGFGLLANTRIAPHELELLQKSIVLSHAAGTVKLMPDHVVRLMMLLKINSLARGFSGIRPLLLDMLIALVSQGVSLCTGKRLGWGQ